MTRPVADLVGAEAAVTDITLESIRQVIGQARNRETRQGRQRKDSSVHAEFRASRAFVRWCARQGWEMDSRLLLMENPEVTGDEVDIFTPAEVRQIQEYFAGSLRDRLIVGLLLGTGIRLAELAGVKLADKHDDRLEVLGKGRKKRWVPLSLQLRKDWTRYVERERPKVDSAALLIGEHCRPFKARGMVYPPAFGAGPALRHGAAAGHSGTRQLLSVPALRPPGPDGRHDAGLGSRRPVLRLLRAASGIQNGFKGRGRCSGLFL